MLLAPMRKSRKSPPTLKIPKVYLGVEKDRESHFPTRTRQLGPEKNIFSGFRSTLKTSIFEVFFQKAG